MFDRVIESIQHICNYREMNIKEKINLILLNYKPEELNEFIEEYIDLHPDLEKYTYNTNGYNYYKYILYSSQEFDIVHIKWEKYAQSRIHDHPNIGCVLMVLNDGKIKEDIYFKSEYNNILIKSNQKRLQYGDMGFIKSNTYLHKITAVEYTETLHIYLPGKYTPNIY
jgi:hypothetical protein